MIVLSFILASCGLTPPQSIKRISAAQMQQLSGFTRLPAFLKFIKGTGANCQFEMTWIPRSDSYLGRRAFMVRRIDGKGNAMLELAFIRWLPTDPGDNMAAFLVDGGFFKSSLYATNAYVIYNTLSQSWIKKGPPRWEVISVARQGSGYADPAQNSAILAFFGEKQ